jgi:hypothetical protein
MGTFAKRNSVMLEGSQETQAALKKLGNKSATQQGNPLDAAKSPGELFTYLTSRGSSSRRLASWTV